MSTEPTATKQSPVAIARLAILIVALAVLGIVLAVSGTDGARDLLNEVGDSRWGFVAFALLYALGVVLLLPGTIGTVSAGAMFGFPAGGFVAVVGAMLGSTAAFCIARSMGREGAEQLLRGRVRDADQFMGRNDFVSVLLLRLMPIMPFNLLNYAVGLTAVRPSRYVAATLLGILPGTFLAAAVGDRADDPTSPSFLVLLAIFVAALLVSAGVGRWMQQKAASDA